MDVAVDHCEGISVVKRRNTMSEAQIHVWQLQDVQKQIIIAFGKGSSLLQVLQMNSGRNASNFLIIYSALLNREQ